MKYLHTISGVMTWTALAAWGWTLACSHALAAAPVPGAAPEAGDSSTSYALPYALVIGAVALGMLVVLRASSRREREKPEEYHSKDMFSRD
jgi:hypothetical protein